MANEITANVTATLTNGSLTDSVPLLQPALSITQAVQDKFEHIFSVTTSDAALTITITTMGLAYFRNLDTVHYLDVGPASAGALVPFMRLKAGEFGLMRLTPGITVRAQANTATCKLQVKIWND